jgi:hypothetical protein
MKIIFFAIALICFYWLNISMLAKVKASFGWRNRFSAVGIKKQK